MKRDRFISRLHRHARKNGLEFRLVKRAGKGSHYVVYVGECRTTVKAGELNPGYIALLLRQLRLPPGAV